MVVKVNMLKELKENFPEKFKKWFKIATITLIVVFSFVLGIEYQIKYQEYTNKTTKIINNSDVNIAIDKNENLILINKNGRCDIYKDSIGYQITEMYARKIELKNKK